MLTKIQCTLMRGGTSKGPYFVATDLPADIGQRDRVLLAAMGSPHARQIDGVGGAEHLTSKVAIVTRSQRPGIDVDYLFAQVGITEAVVDTSPNCGNILTGVGPFAIERALVKAADPVTRVRIFNVNTGAAVEAVVQTPGGVVEYEGDTAIDGVNGTAAAVGLMFRDIVGGSTGGRMFPTGRPREEIDGIPVTLMDVGHPMVFLLASSMGKTGYESKSELDTDRAFLARLEEIRVEAGLRMGLAHARALLPLPTLVAPPRTSEGTVSARNFLPRVLHSAYGVTQTLCTSSACVMPETLLAEVVRRRGPDELHVVIEHVSGTIEADVELAKSADGGVYPSGVAVQRTCRKLFEGYVLVPHTVWAGSSDSIAAV
jgi:4-oxalomesaconate tautomerase